ncbi:hypothetical protein GPECTOR_1g238 [Gonium pectorale]|uniref:Uncharacterized protein n=1 Tax=Gonium pectorale TaxID=33097 RepID=A0A150H2R0_GONPE|nr:hypothetical protein GPECTOR_1g238 [Gonium pectorale]|eukprot:KXZ56272.1 hypothetical protein GPECTOR_1g238 [Gonium pectorale]
MVDSNLLQVKFLLSKGDVDLWHTGARPPVHRWARCQDYSIRITESSPPSPNPSIALALLFAHLPADTRQEVRALSLQCGTPLYSPYPGTPLLYRLTGLRRVDLEGRFQLVPAERHLLFEALTSLDHLEELSVPGCQLVCGVGALASNLRRLKVGYQSKFDLDDTAASAIASLQCLEALTIDLGYAHGQLRRLLAAIPRSVLTVTLPHFPGLGYSTAELRLKGGRLTSLDAPEACMALEDLATLVEVELQPSGAVPTEGFERIALRAIYLTEDSGEWFDFDEPAFTFARKAGSQSPLHTARRLLSQGVRFEVGALKANPFAKPVWVEDCLSLLGMTERTTELHLEFSDGEPDCAPPAQVEAAEAVVRIMVEAEAEAAAREGRAFGAVELATARAPEDAERPYQSGWVALVRAMSECAPPAQVEAAEAVVRIMVEAEAEAAAREGRAFGAVELATARAPEDAERPYQSGWVALVRAMSEAAQAVIDDQEAAAGGAGGRGAFEAQAGESGGEGARRGSGGGGKLGDSRQRLRWLLAQWWDLSVMWGMDIAFANETIEEYRD